MSEGDISQCSMTISIRVIRSFAHRNIRHLVMRGLSPQKLVKDLKNAIVSNLKESQSLPPTVKSYSYDTLKIEHQPHKAKSNDPVINTSDDDELILRDDLTLLEANIVNETTLSFFKMEDYVEYKLNRPDSLPTMLQ